MVQHGEDAHAGDRWRLVLESESYMDGPARGLILL